MNPIQSYDECEKYANSNILALENEFDDYLRFGIKGELITNLLEWDFDLSDYFEVA